MGANGAGKTTAMRIVLGVLAAGAGEVRWRGRPIDRDARRRIGYMPEERGLYPKYNRTVLKLGAPVRLREALRPGR